MTIAFDAADWQRVKDTHRRWWAGQLDRPIVPVTVANREPGRAVPDAPLLSQATCADLSIPADRLIDRLDYELSRLTFLGDGFPFVSMDCFGPGVLAAMLGATLDNSTGRVWFHAPADQPIGAINFRFDPASRWFRRIADIYAAGMRRWGGQVLMGMTDLGGNLDIVSTFRPAERLLLDLYDQPAAVTRLLWEAHQAWHQAFAALNAVLQPVNPGYSDWGGILSDTPSYMLQCDFAYMIGPAMFDEFVRPELAATAGRLDHAFYHLDGKGQLPHLASLLTIGELDGVQWIPGAGMPGCAQWPEVYRAIRAADKKIQVAGTLDDLDAVIAQVGDGRGVHLMRQTVTDEAKARRRLERYGLA